MSLFVLATGYMQPLVHRPPQDTFYIIELSRSYDRFAVALIAIATVAAIKFIVMPSLLSASVCVASALGAVAFYERGLQIMFPDHLKNRVEPAPEAPKRRLGTPAR